MTGMFDDLVAQAKKPAPGALAGPRTILLGPPKPREAPAGYRYGPAGNLQVIPGGPADKESRTPTPPAGYRYDATGTRLERIPGGPADNPDAEGLDPQTTSFYAQQYLASGQMPQLGNGKTAAAARQAIVKEAARQAGAENMSGADLATQIAHYKAGLGNLKNLETQKGSISAAEQTALANGQQYLDRSAELPLQTSVPALNSVIQFGQRHLYLPGHDVISAMDVAHGTYASEYAKVVAGSPSGAGVLSDSARREQLDILNGNYPLSMKQSAYDQTKADMANRMTAINNTIAKSYGDIAHAPVTLQDAVAAGNRAAALPGLGSNGTMPPAFGGKSSPPPGGGSNGGPGNGSGPGGGQSLATMDPNSKLGVFAPTSRVELDPDTSAKLNALIHAGRPFSEAQALAPKGATGLDPTTYAQAVSYAKTHPDWVAAEATRVVPTTLTQRLASSPAAAAVSGAANALTMGNTDEIAGGVAALTGGDYAHARDAFNANKHALADENPTSNLVGNLAGGVAGTMLGGAAIAQLAPGLPAAIAGRLAPAVGYGEGAAAANAATGAARAGYLGDAAYGGAYGAGENNGNRPGGAVTGGMAGAAGGVFGRKLVGPLAEAVMRTGPGQAVSTAFRSGVNMVRPGALAPTSGAPTFSRLDGYIGKLGDNLPQVTANLEDAARLNLPYALADADPKLQMLAGAVTRKSVNARSLAQETFDPRALGQADRAGEAIDQHLAPTGDVTTAVANNKKGAQAIADPLYQQAYTAPAFASDDLDKIMARPAIAGALKQAHTNILNDGRDPTALGLVRDDDGNIMFKHTGPTSVDEAAAVSNGQYAPIETPDPESVLETNKVMTGLGGRVSIKGPLDVTKFARMHGGVADPGGDLAAMGITNAARTNLPFGKNEAYLGKLINPDGMGLDDLGEKLVDAGYLQQRPSVNDVLDILHNEHLGNSTYHPDDQETVDSFHKLNNAAAFVDDKAPVDQLGATATQADMAANAAPPPVPQARPAYTTEALDYTKRALDGKLAPYRTGQKAWDDVADGLQNARTALVNHIDNLNSDYQKARGAYAGQIGFGNAISDGASAASNRLTPTQVQGMVDGLSPQNLPGFQQGYASTLADTVDKTRLTSNPYTTIYGSPAQQAKIATVFPEGAPNFDRVNGLEGDMARTRFETLGGSPTAGRQQADEQLNGGLGTAALDVAGHLATGGGLGVGSMLRVGRQMLGDRWQLGAGSAAADQMAPQLMGTDPNAALAYLTDLANRQGALAVRRQQFARLPGALGLANGMTSSVPAWLGGPGQ